MREILVSGYYGFHNAGDEAILAGLIKAVHDIDPTVRFTVISGTAANTRAVHGVEAISRGDSKAIWSALGRADLLLQGGGSLLQDVTSSKSLIYYLGIVSMAKMRGKPVMFYAQGIGPIRGAVGKTLTPLIANRVNQITVRDDESAQTLEALGVRRPPVTVTADPALTLGPSDPEWGARLLQEQGVDLSRPIIGVSVRPWGQRGWESELAKGLDQLAQESGAQVVFLPMMQVRFNDVATAKVVADQMRTPAILAQGDLTFTHLQAMIARCDLLVGLRYHALVFAAMNQVPLVGLSYDPKNDSFLKQIGECAAGDTERLQAAAIVESGRRALSDVPAVKARLQARVAELAPRSRQNATIALELLNQRSKP